MSGGGGSLPIVPYFFTITPYPLQPCHSRSPSKRMKRTRGPWDDSHHDAPLLQSQNGQGQEGSQDSDPTVAPHQHHHHLQPQPQPQPQQRQVEQSLTEEGYATPGLIGIEGRVLKKLRRITLSSNPPLQSSPESEVGGHSPAPWQAAVGYSNRNALGQYQQHHFQQAPSAPSQEESAAALFNHGPIRISTRTHITLQPPTIHVPDSYTHQSQQHSQPHHHQQQQQQQQQRHQQPHGSNGINGSLGSNGSNNIDNQRRDSLSTSLQAMSSTSLDNLGVAPQNVAMYSQMNSLLQELHTTRFGLPLESPSMGPLCTPQHHQHPQQPQQQQQQQQQQKGDEDDDMMEEEAFSALVSPLQHQPSQSVILPLPMENHEYDDINAQLRAAFLARHQGAHLQQLT
ncbi:hypothetical protein DFQ26_008364 [Actinomortierella ambigua]|nr:hypothetical protein DFQ26_008364 [Actinomortierella ambigua]